MSISNSNIQTNNKNSELVCVTECLDMRQPKQNKNTLSKIEWEIYLGRREKKKTNFSLREGKQFVLGVCLVGMNETGITFPYLK